MPGLLVSLGQRWPRPGMNERGDFPVCVFLVFSCSLGNRRCEGFWQIFIFVYICQHGGICWIDHSWNKGMLAAGGVFCKNWTVCPYYTHHVAESIDKGDQKKYCPNVNKKLKKN